MLVRPRKLIARCAILSHEPKITEATLVSSPPRSPPSEGFHLATTLQNIWVAALLFSLACSRLSDSGEDVKEKGTRKVGGAEKRNGDRQFSLSQEIWATDTCF